MQSKKPPESPEASAQGDPPHTNAQAAEDRAQRLARLKLAVGDGTYKISAEDIAEKVIDRLLKAGRKP